MRLPTVNQFKNEINSLTNQFDAIKNLQSQVASGKKIGHSFENPLLGERIKAVSDFIENIKGYELNGTLAENRTALFASTTQENINVFGRIQELVQNAQNDTLNNTDRNNIAQDLKGYVDVLMRMANTQDSKGEYIYSGINVTVPPFTKIAGGYAYQGAQDATKVALGTHITVPYNESGQRIFGDIKSGNGIFSLSSSVQNTGTGVATTSGMNQKSTFLSDDYTITFVMNSSGKKAYQVVGQNTGQIIPPPPLLMPADAPEFVAGTSIEFNGASLNMGGEPAAGDIFELKPCKTQNVFDILQNIINILNKPVNSDQEKAHFQQSLGEGSSSVKQIQDHLIMYLTEIGNRGKTIDDQIAIRKNLLVDQHIVLGRMADADMGEVISDLTQRLSALEVTQQSYLKIQETFYNLLKR